jgi:hypothetical protein
METYVIMEWPLFERMVTCVPCVEEGDPKNAKPWLKDGWEKKKAIESDICVVCNKTIKEEN